MKKLILFSLFSTILLFISCSKTENKENITPDILAQVQSLPTIDDAIGISNTPKTGSIYILSTKGFNQTVSAVQISGTIKNTNTQFGNIKVNETTLTRKNYGHYSTAENEISAIKNMFGSTIDYKTFDEGNNLVFQQNHQVFPELNANLPSNNNTLSRTSSLTWNSESGNTKGVYVLILSLSSTDNRPVAIRTKQLPDNGAYRFKETDFDHVPIGSKCRIYMIRGNMDKYKNSFDENFFIVSGTIVSSDYNL